MTDMQAPPGGPDEGKSRAQALSIARTGKFEIFRVEEMQLLEPAALLKEWRPDMISSYPDWLDKDFYAADSGSFRVSIHSWVIKSPTHTIIVDTCGGNHKARPASARFDQLDLPYLERLAAIGVAPEQVDFVICTHLHVDHLGWNTRLVNGQWVPTFPNATYVLSSLDCKARDPANVPPEAWQPAHLVFLDSVQPVIEAGLAWLAQGDEEIVPGINLVPMRGHSPGQMGVRLRSEGQEALFVGDVVHHPLQVFNPDWNSRYCENAEMARATRKQVLHHCSRHASLFLPAHFARPHCGHIHEAGQAGEGGHAFSFTPLQQQALAPRQPK